MKQKTCKACGNKFTPVKPMQSVCDWSCANLYTIKLAEKRKKLDEARKRKEYREAKEKQKTRADWMREAQQVFNAYIRARDKDYPCISSGVGNISYVSGIPKQTAWDAGHYRTVGSCPELRFCELNVHKQSVHDNQHLHGNLIEYRKGLIARIGLDKVEWLESKHPAKHYSIDDLKEIKRIYKEKLKEFK